MADEKPEIHDEQWRQRLTALQYEVTRQKGTEPPFTGEYCDTTADGVYACVCCGKPLYSSGAKYKSGTGWPSFWEAIRDGSVTTQVDKSHGMARTELLCSHCDAHLGHVFDDGPQPTGQRHCINSASLKLVEGADEAKESGE